jgi:hypothetical protein
MCGLQCETQICKLYERRMGSKTETEKSDYKELILKQPARTTSDAEGMILQQLQSIAGNVATIKGIMVFFAALFIIGIIVSLVIAARIGGAYSDFMDLIRYGY